jgi:hypothetical protein
MINLSYVALGQYLAPVARIMTRQVRQPDLIHHTSMGSGHEGRNQLRRTREAGIRLVASMGSGPEGRNQGISIHETVQGAGQWGPATRAGIRAREKSGL